MTAPIEARRRELKASQPDLYDYIGAVESARALDSAGMAADREEIGFAAANRVWEHHRRALVRADALRNPTLP